MNCSYRILVALLSVVVVALFSTSYCHAISIPSSQEYQQNILEPSETFGRIEVQLISASFSKEEHAFVRVCVQNSTETVSFPIKDWDQRCQGHCATEIPDRSSANPQWNQHCHELDQSLFRWDSRVSFEVLNIDGTGYKQFFGGASKTIPELVQARLNHRTLHLPVKDSEFAVAGQINVLIGWTEA